MTEPKFKVKSLFFYEEKEPDIVKEGYKFWLIDESIVLKKKIQTFAVHKPDGEKTFVAYWKGNPIAADRSAEGVFFQVRAKLHLAGRK